MYSDAHLIDWKMNAFMINVIIPAALRKVYKRSATILTCDKAYTSQDNFFMFTYVTWRGGKHKIPAVPLKLRNIIIS